MKGIDTEHLKQVAAYREQKYLDRVKRLKENGRYYWHLPGTMAIDAEAMAIRSLHLDKDVIGFKRYLYLAAKCTEAAILVEPLNTPDSPHYTKAFSYRVLWKDHTAFYWALIAQHKDVTNSLAHLLGWKGEKWELKKSTRWSTRFGLAVKYTLLGQDEEALQQIQTLQNRKIPRYVEAYTMLLKSIIDGSQQQTQEWLEVAVKRFRRGDYDDIEIMCAIPVIGLGWLAKSRGLEVSLDHPLAPAATFVHHDFTYPETDFLPKEIQGKTWQDLVEGRYP